MTNIHVRLEVANVTPEQHRAWKAAAKREQRSLSSWIRAELDKAVKRQERRI